jgi:hypothetical protein
LKGACPTCRRPITHDKTHEQRKKFHAICREISNQIGLTPGQVKAAIKQDQFGIDEFKMGNKWYRTVKSSEDTDRVEYSELIEAAYRWGAENEVVITE